MQSVCDLLQCVSSSSEMFRNDKELAKLRKEIARTRISICDPSRNGNHAKLQGKIPVCTMVIPNALQIVWRKYRAQENSMGRPLTDFVDLANWSLDSLVLKKGVASIETRKMGDFTPNIRN